MTNYTAMSIDQLAEYRDRCAVFRKEREHVDAIIRHRRAQLERLDPEDIAAHGSRGDVFEDLGVSAPTHLEAAQ